MQHIISLIAPLPANTSNPSYTMDWYQKRVNIQQCGNVEVD